MDWYSVALTAFSAALAILLASFIFGKKPEKENYINYALVVILVFSLVSISSNKYILPEINSIKIKYDVQKTLSAIPGMQKIKKHEPGAYAVMQEILIETKKMGYGSKMAAEFIQREISTIVNKWLPKSSDQAIISNIKVIIEEIDELQDQGGELCFRFLFPEDGNEIDKRKSLSKEMQKRDLAAANLIIQTYDPSRPIPKKEQVLPILEPILLEMYDIYGNDFLVLEDPATDNINKTETCTIVKSFYLKILEHNQNESVAVFRFLLSNKI